MSEADHDSLPPGWATCRIGDLVASDGVFVDGDWVESKDQDPHGDVRLIQLADVGEGRFLDKSARFLTKKSARNLSCTFLKTGDLLVARMPDPLGRCCIFPLEGDEKYVTVVDVCIVRPGASPVDRQYLMYLINSPTTRGRIEAMQSGSTRKRISRKKLATIPLPLAPINEQRRIVSKLDELLSELADGIESLTIAREQLEAYRQAVLKHAFEGKLTAQWREEHKGQVETIDQLLERIPSPQQPRGGRQPSREVIEGIGALAVNKPAKPAPTGWSWVPLLRITRQETGHTPSRKHPEYWDGDEFWIGIADARLNHGREIHNTIQKVTQAGLENSSARTLPAGTVCLSRTASVGYVCVMAEPMATSQDFATWTCTEALDPKFLMYALMAEGEEIKRFGKGTTHTTIYFPEIRALNICLPPIEEQKLIVRTVETRLLLADKLEAEINAGLLRCHSMRQSVFRSAYAGKLVEQDPSDEPASVLLEQISAEKQALAQKSRSGRRKAKTKEKTARQVEKRKDAA